MLSEYVKNIICTQKDSKKSAKKRVKILRSGTCDDDSRYVASYKNRVYAISTDSQLVHDYMRVHRKLKDDEYQLELLDSSDLKVVSNIDCELVEYHNLYVADRDVVMSKLFMKDVGTELKDLQISLISIARLIGQCEKDSSIVKQLMKTYMTLDQIRTDSGYVEELEEIGELDNRFIYSDMDTYNHLLGQYEVYFQAFNWKSLN